MTTETEIGTEKTKTATTTKTETVTTKKTAITTTENNTKVLKLKGAGR